MDFRQYSILLHLGDSQFSVDPLIKSFLQAALIDQAVCSHVVNFKPAGCIVRLAVIVYFVLTISRFCISRETDVLYVKDRVNYVSRTFRVDPVGAVLPSAVISWSRSGRVTYCVYARSFSI